MLAKLGIFFGGFIAPVPLILIALMVAALLAALAVANGRISVGMPKSVARHEWDAARRRREERANSPQ
ncbi:MAG: hypothetical protein LBC97_07340 [Bifidobacteriaceae bacterium]|jgi:Na+/H+ antiporter NhaD/arsenite permease-like protein|nr:hypothetical protein [Bifidobacteriaceae bacterium]